MKVSIVVPIYNTEKYLRRCLMSIINQKASDIEIILVNDGSTDSSIDIINEFAELDNRIIVINKTNSGLSSARNSGIDVAKGEYILHIDSDDWIEPNYIHDIYEYAISLQLDMVVTDAYWDWDDGHIEYKKDINIKEYRILNNMEYLDYFFKGKARPVVWNKLFKTNLYKENNIKHPDGISLGEDLATTPKLAFHANRIGKINKAYVHYIQNPHSITKCISSARINEIIEVISSLRLFFKKNNFNLDTLELRTLFYIVNGIYSKSESNRFILNRFISLCKENNQSNFSYKIRLYVFLVRLFPRVNTVIFLNNTIKKVRLK